MVLALLALVRVWVIFLVVLVWEVLSSLAMKVYCLWEVDPRNQQSYSFSHFLPFLVDLSRQSLHWFA